MKLSSVKDAAKVCLESKQATLCLVGVSGSGKTSIWSQIYKDLGFEGFVILRPALLADAADLVGLPDFEIIQSGGKAVKTTAFMRPKWLPMEGQKILVIIDEINRVTKDVANALFGLIESEKPFIGEYKLPQGCGVVATCNPPTDNYAGVLDFADNAWTSRLCFVKIAPDIDTYTKYGRESGTVSNVMLDFLNKNPKFFGTSGAFEVDMFFNKDGETEETNTRSFSKASGIYNKASELKVNREVAFELIRGIKGLEFATSFMQFADNYSNVITLDDLLNDDNAHERFEYEALSNVSKVLEDFKHRVQTEIFNDDQNKNFLQFLKKIPLDTLQGFVMWISTNNNDSVNGDLSEFLDKLSNLIAEDEDIDRKLDLICENINEIDSENGENNETIQND